MIDGSFGEEVAATYGEGFGLAEADAPILPLA